MIGKPATSYTSGIDGNRELTIFKVDLRQRPALSTDGAALHPISPRLGRRARIVARTFPQGRPPKLISSAPTRNIFSCGERQKLDRGSPTYNSYRSRLV